MAALIILTLAGLVCVVGVLIMLYLVIKYKNEEFVIGFIVGMLICVGGAIWCTTEGLKRADIYDKANK